MSWVEKRGDKYRVTWLVDGRRHKKTIPATSKKEAEAIAAELERDATYLSMGFSQAPGHNEFKTFGQMLEWLRDSQSKEKAKSTRGSDASRMQNHLLGTELAASPPHQITTGKINEFLTSKLYDEKTNPGGLKGASLNRVRALISKAFSAAIAGDGRFTGNNPAKGCKKWDEDDDIPEYYLREDEVIRAFAQIPPRHKHYFIGCLFTGQRKGELAGLRKTDIDFSAGANGLIFVRHSYDRKKVKGKKAKAIPIAKELRPFLERAMSESKGELVYPGKDGISMRSKNERPPNILRAALRRAGIVESFKHKCGAKNCGHTESHPDDAQRLCPVHQRVMLATGVPRPIRLHDLRHSVASILTMRGAKPKAVQSIMRHHNSKMTDRYTHLEPDYLQEEINLLHFGLGDVVSSNKVTTSKADSIPKLPLGTQDDENLGFSGQEGVPLVGKSEQFEWDKSGRPSGIEPLTPGATDHSYHVQSSTIKHKLEHNHGLSASVAVQLSAINPLESTRELPLGTQDFRRNPFMGLVPGGAPAGFLTVAQAATYLGSSQFPIYRAINSGALPSLSISSWRYVAEVDLRMFAKSYRQRPEGGAVMCLAKVMSDGHWHGRSELLAAMPVPNANRFRARLSDLKKEMAVESRVGPSGFEEYRRIPGGRKS